MNSKPPLDYSSFLLRLWRECEGDNMRITLQNVADGKQRHFSDLQGLIVYLRSQNEIKGDEDQ